MRGHDFPGTDGAPVDLAVGGPMSPQRDDLALAMSVLAGPDADDAVAYRPRRRPGAGLAGARILLLDAHPAARPTPRSADAIGALAAPGRCLARVALRRRAGAPTSGRVVTRSRDARRHHDPRRPERRPPISAHAWMLLDQRGASAAAGRSVHDAFDVVVMPPFRTAAFEHLTEPGLDRRTLVSITGKTPTWPSGVAGRRLARPGCRSRRADHHQASRRPISVRSWVPWLETSDAPRRRARQAARRMPSRQRQALTQPVRAALAVAR